jgi:hypothetical protein
VRVSLGATAHSGGGGGGGGSGGGGGFWVFEFNLYSTGVVPTLATPRGEQLIEKGGRALLWYGGKPWDKYQHAVVCSGLEILESCVRFCDVLCVRAGAEFVSHGG